MESATETFPTTFGRDGHVEQRACRRIVRENLGQDNPHFALRVGDDEPGSGIEGRPSCFDQLAEVLLCSRGSAGVIRVTLARTEHDLAERLRRQSVQRQQLPTVWDRLGLSQQSACNDLPRIHGRHHPAERAACASHFQRPLLPRAS